MSSIDDRLAALEVRLQAAVDEGARIGDLIRQLDTLSRFAALEARLVAIEACQERFADACRKAAAELDEIERASS